MVQTARARARVVLARERLHELDLAMAAGLEGNALAVLERVRPPDATPFGEGLVDRGGFISYVGGKRVGGDADKKPEDMRVMGQGVVVGVGFSFPGRFQEMGTVRQPPRPFLTPAVMSVVGDESIVVNAVRVALAGKLQSMARKNLRYRMKATP
jgi:hypothetical protein